MVAKSGDLLLEKGERHCSRSFFRWPQLLLPIYRRPRCSAAVPGQTGALKEAARILHAAGSSAVLLKGGHAQEENGRGYFI